MNFNFIPLFFLTFLVFSQEKKLWTLEDCTQYAKNQNIEVLESLLKEDLASVALKAAKRSFLPSLNFKSDYIFQSGADLSISTSFQNLDYNQNSLDSSIVLFDGLKNFHHLAKSKLEKQLARNQTQEVRLKLETKVMEYFLAALLSKEKLNASFEQFSISQNMHTQIEKKYKAGILPRRDLINSEADLAIYERNLVTIENQLEINRIRLALLLGLKDLKNFEILQEEFFINTEALLKLNPEELEQKAFLFRPEIKSANLKAQIATKNLSVKKASMLPTLTFGYRFYFLLDSEDNRIKMKSQNILNRFTLSLNWPIFDNYSINADIKRASIEQKLKELDLEKNKNELRTSIHQIYVDAKNAYWAYKAAEKSENSSKLSFEYAKKSYEAGVINLYDFINAKNSWLKTKLMWINHKYQLLFKMKIMELYIGK